VAVLMGAAMLAWCAHGFLVPNEHFRFRLLDVPKLFLPFLFVGVGWSWMRGDVSQGAQGYPEEFTITVKLSGTEYGSGSERQEILDLKHRLDGRLKQTNLGEIDGEEFGGGECVIFVQTNAPSKAVVLAQEVFSSKQPCISYGSQTSEKE
jgi:hypothetical protein